MTFTWNGFHDVHIHPSFTCAQAGRKMVGASSGASYSFTEADVGEVVFACDVGSHCETGQIMRVTVSAMSMDTMAPTPTTMETMMPTATKETSASSAYSIITGLLIGVSFLLTISV
eukprot:CAMPEP_0118709134 /NCGR_PEP_ID=MMETSP0800-20121206/22411_1 /TAXON_ID=210618 ORGANISM="Striatella unipunctata, Strain CCMP2910" /NCGR_SAMPLE_ID=MMETSP0800 /ASSEMBLY_ACC=CAM_ASM_000638 /LENGTH=115 /DNA_ID=CAMNT_0006612679 /DNA_START=118 /DNA_END=465 /DNA_ORIENTATION=-